MKPILLLSFILCFSFSTHSQILEPIELDSVDLSQGLNVMEALKVRESATAFDTAMITSQELSSVIWAANGVNRPESGKRTAPSATNAQDIDIYVCMETGIYLYDHTEHILYPVIDGDHRRLVAGRQPWTAEAPVFLIMVSDISRFSHGNDSTKLIRAAMDAGIVAQNISLYCAAVGLETRIRAIMNKDKLREVMGLKPTQYLMLNNPVGYRPKE